MIPGLPLDATNASHITCRDRNIHCNPLKCLVLNLPRHQDHLLMVDLLHWKNTITDPSCEMIDGPESIVQIVVNMKAEVVKLPASWTPVLVLYSWKITLMKTKVLLLFYNFERKRPETH